jgi:hypothetical protein
MHFLRVPGPGPVTVSAQADRIGRSLTSVSGKLEQEGELIGLAVGAWSKPWEGPLLDAAPMPDVVPPQGRASAAAEFPRDDPPAFTGQLTMQHRFGDPPWTGSERAETGGWLGLLEERPVDALAVAVLADAWFPAPWPRLKALAPAPTIDLTVHFRAPQLWAADGTLVAQSRQLGLLIGAEA